MAENTRYIARVPIVPDDFENKSRHKQNELVMDYSEDDIYVKKNDGYVNITGRIKESIKEITDGSAVIHIVTEDTVPPVKERSENNWYYIITDAKTVDSKTVDTETYVFYGLVNSYYKNKNYILIAQNVIEGSSVVKFDIEEGYSACLYIPINFGASFTDANTGETIGYSIEDRTYALNTKSGSYVTYDVYILDLTRPGEYNVFIDLEGSDMFKMTIDTNEPFIEGLTLPNDFSVRDGNCIGKIDDPVWNSPRYIFEGWSTTKDIENIINPVAYKPESDMTLYAWFSYDDSEASLEYYSTFVSNGGVI